MARGGNCAASSRLNSSWGKLDLRRKHAPGVKERGKTLFLPHERIRGTYRGWEVWLDRAQETGLHQQGGGKKQGGAYEGIKALKYSIQGGGRGVLEQTRKKNAGCAKLVVHRYS